MASFGTCFVCSNNIIRGEQFLKTQTLYAGQETIESAAKKVLRDIKCTSNYACKICFNIFRKWARAYDRMFITENEIKKAAGRGGNTADLTAGHIQLDIGKSLLEACCEIRDGFFMAGISAIKIKTMPSSVSLSIENADISHFVGRSASECHIDFTLEAFESLPRASNDSRNDPGDVQENIDHATDTEDSCLPNSDQNPTVADDQNEVTRFKRKRGRPKRLIEVIEIAPKNDTPNKTSTSSDFIKKEKDESDGNSNCGTFPSTNESHLPENSEQLDSVDLQNTDGSCSKDGESMSDKADLPKLPPESDIVSQAMCKALEPMDSLMARSIRNRATKPRNNGSISSDATLEEDNDGDYTGETDNENEISDQDYAPKTPKRTDPVKPAKRPRGRPKTNQNLVKPKKRTFKKTRRDFVSDEFIPTCEKCGTKFKSIAYLKLHTQRLHKGDVELLMKVEEIRLSVRKKTLKKRKIDLVACPVCGVAYQRSLNGIRSHLIKMHPSYDYTQFMDNLAEVPSLVLPGTTDGGEPEDSPDIVEDGSQSTTDPQDEIASLRKSTCDLCGKEFLDELLLLHLRNEHAGEPNLDEAIAKFRANREERYKRKLCAILRSAPEQKCPFCEKMVKKIVAHIRRCPVNPDAVQFKGCSCGFRAKSEEDMSKHRVECTKSKRRCLCDICGCEFSSKPNMYQHRRLKHGICGKHRQLKRIPCPICNKVFPSDYRLEKHMVVHTGKRDFICETCGKDFKISEHLRSHIQTQHLGKFPYYCSKCGHGMDKKKKLERHRCELVRRVTQPDGSRVSKAKLRKQEKQRAEAAAAMGDNREGVKLLLSLNEATAKRPLQDRAPHENEEEFVMYEEVAVLPITDGPVKGEGFIANPYVQFSDALTAQNASEIILTPSVVENTTGSNQTQIPQQGRGLNLSASVDRKKLRYLPNTAVFLSSDRTNSIQPRTATIQELHIHPSQSVNQYLPTDMTSSGLVGNASNLASSIEYPVISLTQSQSHHDPHQQHTGTQGLPVTGTSTLGSSAFAECINNAMSQGSLEWQHVRLEDDGSIHYMNT